MDSEVFAVVDAKSGEDITRSILLQIILEEEANGSPMFTAPVLANIIRFYGHTMQGMMGGYLEKNMQALMDMQVPMVPGCSGQQHVPANAGADAKADRTIPRNLWSQALSQPNTGTIGG